LADVPEVLVDADGLSNGLLSVTVEPAGTLRLQTVGGIELGGVGRLVDGGDVGDLYNYGPPPRDVLIDEPQSVTREVLEDSPLRARVEVSRSYLWPAAAASGRVERSTDLREAVVRMVVELRSGEPFVRLALTLDNPCRDHRLRLHVPLHRPAQFSDAEGQFAVVRRGLTAEGGVGEEPVPTFPARGWVDAGGVALLLDHVSEYELVDVDEGQARGVAVTVLRAVGQISRSDHPMRALNAGPESPTPSAQLQGEQELSLAVYPHGGDWFGGDVAAAAERYHHPFVSVAGNGAAEHGEQEAEGLLVEGVGVQLCALRRRGDWLEARVLCQGPAGVDATLTGAFATAREAGLLGRSGPELVVRRGDRGSVRLELSPWELRTVWLRAPR
jgi:alpha-mannosidase